MKNRVLGILVTGLLMVSLTGCGAKTEATEQVAESSEVVEAGNVDETENVSSEENESASVGAEDENIVLYAEKGEHSFVGQKDNTFESKNVSFVANENIPLYDGDGYEIGYVKANGNITVTEGAVDTRWDRFENPYVDGDYLYISRQFVPSENGIVVTTETVKQSIVSYISSMEDCTILDTPTSDMEMYEFRVYATYDEQMMYDYDVWSYCHNDSFDIGDYMTYAIETTEDDGDILCKIYYKDLYED